MAGANSTTICYDASLQQCSSSISCSHESMAAFRKTMGGALWRVNTLVLVDAILAGVIVEIGAYAQRYRHHLAAADHILRRVHHQHQQQRLHQQLRVCNPGSLMPWRLPLFHGRVMGVPCADHNDQHQRDSGCRRQRRPEQRAPGPAACSRITATHLSRYCAYLMAWSPDLLPDDDEWSRSLYETVKKDAKRALAGRAAQGSLAPMAEFEQVAQLLLIVDSKYEVLKNGVRLGKQLVVVKGEERAWVVLAEFWSEMIPYIAPSDNIRGHLKAIARGGELITLLWAMLTHAGILSRRGDAGGGAAAGEAAAAPLPVAVRLRRQAATACVPRARRHQAAPGPAPCRSRRPSRRAARRLGCRSRARRRFPAAQIAVSAARLSKPRLPRLKRTRMDIPDRSIVNSGALKYRRHILRLPDQERKVKVLAAVKICLFDVLRNSHSNKCQLSNGIASLRRSQVGESFLWACNSMGTSDIILTWRIATSILELLPDEDEWSKSLYNAVKEDATRVLAVRAATGLLTPEIEYQDLVQLLSEDSKHEVLKNGVRLGKQLVELVEGEEAA
ncbi:hypothetical protein C2845_PM04G02170 [Panicum miliaceum]|uniref:DUF4220 domain-containing protein n=1 Tax=Panicum miliaceum TaxID=4540 RepID=A0A3L6QMG1_PANMI|nr:hypothetical protein C2845_PM04G02170 [Panicum miliaceum]